MNYLAPLPESTVYHDLWESLEKYNVECPDFTFDLDKYRTEETEFGLPALRKAGYILQGDWFDGERDSFGPLSRCIHAVDPDGNNVVVVYG